MEEVKEHCGVLGFCLKDDSEDSFIVPYLGEKGLSAIENRGQDGAGAYSLKKRKGKYGKIFGHVKDERTTVYKLFGGSDENKRKEIYEELKGIAFLAHVRYGTSGERSGHAQPGYRWHGRRGKKFVFCWNGNLPNAPELEERILGPLKDYDLETDVDTELILHLFSKKLKRRYEGFDLRGEKEPDFFDISEDCIPEMDGAFNIAFMFGDGKIGAIRDPWGFRDLVYGENEKIIAVASESTALTRMGISRNRIERMPKGGVLLMDKNSLEVKSMFPCEKESLCFFEGEYFSNVSSTLGGVPIYLIRERGGDELFLSETKEHLKHIEKNKERTVVVATPNTAFDSASQYAFRLGVPLRRGLIKVYSSDKPKRGFINPENFRGETIDNLYQIVPEVFDDNIVHIVEDSTVRGDTFRKIISYIKSEAKPREIHARVTTPPIIAPCFYAVDMSTFKELIANQFPSGSISELEKELTNYFEINSFRYMTHAGLDSMFRELKGKLCKACITGVYPTKFGMRRAIEQKKKWESEKREFLFRK